VVDREFWVAEGCQAEFEKFFGSSGDWARLLQGSEGYSGSEAWCESVIEMQFRVRDFWTSHQHFESFRERFAADYDRLMRLLYEEGLIIRERLVGTYYEREPGREDGDDLIPA
jgi:hypothetical protein